jgi:hypothetical protein
MTDHDDHERDTLTPDPRGDERHAERPPPPWERGTAPGQAVESRTQPAPSEFGKTQPITPPTAEDVLDVFGKFQEHLLGQIDKRDERILLAIQDIGSQILEQYQRGTQRDDEQDRWIKQLRHRTHKQASMQQAFDIRLALIEQKLGIEPPAALPSTPEEELEPRA